MEFTIENSISLLIAIFFIITYFFSAFEKLTDWKGTITYYNEHFSNTPIKSWIPISIKLIVFIEIVILILFSIGMYQFIDNQNINLLTYSYLASAGLLLIFLIGQRFAKDYPGATSITIYFILNILGLYFLI